jgi:hypothetical protein
VSFVFRSRADYRYFFFFAGAFLVAFLADFGAAFLVAFFIELILPNVKFAIYIDRSVIHI